MSCENMAQPRVHPTVPYEYPTWTPPPTVPVRVPYCSSALSLFILRVRVLYCINYNYPRGVTCCIIILTRNPARVATTVRYRTVQQAAIILLMGLYPLSYQYAGLVHFVSVINGALLGLYRHYRQAGPR